MTGDARSLPIEHFKNWMGISENIIVTSESRTLKSGAEAELDARLELPKLKSSEMLKGTGDVLKDIAYAQKFTEDADERGMGRELQFVDRALRVAMGEIKRLRHSIEQLKARGKPAHGDARLAAIVQEMRKYQAAPAGVIPATFAKIWADQLAALQPEDGQ